MAKRKINIVHPEFWEDPFVKRALTLAQGHFFLMLLTRWPECSAGIISVSVEELYVQFCPREFSVPDIEKALAVLEGAGKIMYDTGQLWVVNYLKRHDGEERSQGGRPDWISRSIARDLGDCHSRIIYDAFIDKYQHHPLFPATMPPYRYGESGPPDWFDIGGPEPKAVKRPPVKPEPKRVEQTVPDVRAVVDRVWAAYVATMDSGLSLTDKRRDKILARLSDKIIDRTTKQPRPVTPEDLIAVIATCRASAFHMGTNDQGKRYNMPEDHLFRNQEQVEKWLEVAATNHRPARTPERPVPPLTQEERLPMTDEERTVVEREAAEARAKTRALLAGIAEQMP